MQKVHQGTRVQPQKNPSGDVWLFPYCSCLSFCEPHRGSDDSHSDSATGGKHEVKPMFQQLRLQLRILISLLGKASCPGLLLGSASLILLLLVNDPFTLKKQMGQSPKQDGPPCPANCSCKPLWLSRCSVGFLAIHSTCMRVALEPGQHGTAS